MRWIGVLAMVGLAQAPAAYPAAGPARRPDFTGRWTFNAGKSDDARAKLQAAMQGGRRGGFGGPGRGGPMEGGLPPGGGRGGPMGGLGGGPQDIDAMRGAMDDVLEPAKVLTVTQADPELTVVRDDGRVRHLYADGRKAKEPNGTAERRTRWDGNRLVSEIKLEGGRKLTEVWAMAEDGRELRSSVKVKLGLADLVVDQIYDLERPE